MKTKTTGCEETRLGTRDETHPQITHSTPPRARANIYISRISHCSDEPSATTDIHAPVPTNKPLPVAGAKSGAAGRKNVPFGFPHFSTIIRVLLSVVRNCGWLYRKVFNAFGVGRRTKLTAWIGPCKTRAPPSAFTWFLPPPYTRTVVAKTSRFREPPHQLIACFLSLLVKTSTSAPLAPPMSSRHRSRPHDVSHKQRAASNAALTGVSQKRCPFP